MKKLLVTSMAAVALLTMVLPALASTTRTFNAENVSYLNAYVDGFQTDAAGDITAHAVASDKNLIMRIQGQSEPFIQCEVFAGRELDVSCTIPNAPAGLYRITLYMRNDAHPIETVTVDVTAEFTP